MTDNASTVEEIVRSLSFEVVAIPDKSQKVIPSSTSKATPLNIKVKVKKKHEAGLQHGLLATSLKGPDEVPQRIRLVSSDQTIVSFHAVIEDIDFDKSKARKPNLLNIDNHPYIPSTTEACQSESTLKNKFTLSKAEDNSNKKRDIFGRCKPGGCLDPPFGEDKYSYEPSKQQQETQIQDAAERKRTSSIFSNKLFKKIKKAKTGKVDVKKDPSESNQSVTSLYQTGSLQTSYSNSIITYPSPLTGSDDKVIQDRQKSPKNSVTRKLTESDNGSLYIIPKKTRASLEKEEAKLKSERSDTNLDLSKEPENTDDVRKLNGNETTDTIVLNNLDKVGAEYLNSEEKEEAKLKFVRDYTNLDLSKEPEKSDDVKKLDYNEKTDTLLLLNLDAGGAEYLNSEKKKEAKLKSEKNDRNLDLLKGPKNTNEVRKLDNNEKIDTSPLNNQDEIGAEYLNSQEKEEAKLKSERDDTNLDLLKGPENTDDVRKLDDNEKIDTSAFNNLNEGGAEYLNSEEKEEAKLQFDRDDTNLFLSKGPENTDNVRIFDDIEKTDTSPLNNLDTGRAEYNSERHSYEVNKTNYQAKNELRSEPKAEEYLYDKRVNSALELKQDSKIDNATSEVKTGLVAAGVAAATAGIAATLLADSKDSNKTKQTSDDTSVYKLSRTDNEDLTVDEDFKIDDNNSNKTILSDNGDNINDITATGNIINDLTEHDSGSDDGDQLSSNTTDYNDSNAYKHEGISTEDSKILSNKDLSKVTQSRVTEALMGDTNELINEAEDFDTGKLVSKDRENTSEILSNDLSDNRELDKLCRTDNEDLAVDEDLKVDVNKTNNTILNYNGYNINETATGNIIDNKTEHDSGSDDGDQLSTNTTDYINSDVYKHEGRSTEDGKILLNKDLSKIAESGITDALMGDTNKLINKTKDFDTDKLVSKDHDDTSKIPSDDLSNNREFDDEISSLDTSNKIDKEVSKSNIVEEMTHPKNAEFADSLTKDNRESESKLQPTSSSYTKIRECDKDNQNISIRHNNSVKMSKNNEDIVSVLNRQKDLQEMLEKEKGFNELGGTHGNYKTQSELKREDAFDYKDMDIKQSKNIVNNDRLNNLTNDVIKINTLQSERDTKDDFDYEDTKMKHTKNIFENNGQSNISNNVIKRDISSDRLRENYDLGENLSKNSSDRLRDNEDINKNLSKRHQLQPGSSSGSESLKEIKIKKAADGDKQKKRKESAEQFKTKIDLGFHTYTNENNELILKTFDSKTPPSRYPRDSVIVANCDLKDPFEFKVPFGTEQYLRIQIEDNEKVTEILPGIAKSSTNSLKGKKQIPKLHKINEQMNSTVKNATQAIKLINKDIVKAQMKDIYGTYENELVPLQKSLTRLKQDVDVLILHQKAIRNNLLTKRLKIQETRKCGCVKKLK